MTIQIGDRIPDCAVQIIGGAPPLHNTSDLFASRKTVLFGVPGAFTPTCSNEHLPGYTHHFDEFKQSDIQVICMAVNDTYVMQAWASSQHVPPDMLMLADGNGEFTQALGLEFDGAKFGMGLRARRFALFAENGVVKLLHIEAPGELRVSTAEAMLVAISKLTAIA
ncbi:MAG: peroxiredoxin [Rhodanobacter sp.]